VAPWARPNSGFSLRMEALLVTLCKAMAVSQVAQLPSVSDRRVWRTLEEHRKARERIQELEARLAKDSHNSSRPPSSDSPFKKPPPCSQRQPSGRKPSGQPGRCGVTRSLVDHPDQCGIIPLTGTCACGRCGTGIATTGLAERRQVVEVVIQRKVIEYRIVGGTGALWARATQHVSCKD